MSPDWGKSSLVYNVFVSLIDPNSASMDKRMKPEGDAPMTRGPTTRMRPHGRGVHAAGADRAGSRGRR